MHLLDENMWPRRGFAFYSPAPAHSGVLRDLQDWTPTQAPKVATNVPERTKVTVAPSGPAQTSSRSNARGTAKRSPRTCIVVFRGTRWLTCTSSRLLR